MNIYILDVLHKLEEADEKVVGDGGASTVAVVVGLKEINHLFLSTQKRFGIQPRRSSVGNGGGVEIDALIGSQITIKGVGCNQLGVQRLSLMRLLKFYGSSIHARVIQMEGEGEFGTAATYTATSPAYHFQNIVICSHIAHLHYQSTALALAWYYIQYNLKVLAEKSSATTRARGGTTGSGSDDRCRHIAGYLSRLLLRSTATTTTAERIAIAGLASPLFSNETELVDHLI